MALTPKYLQDCTDEIDEDFRQLVTEILVDMAKRISTAKEMTSTSEYLNEKLRVLSLQQKQINTAIAKTLNTSEKNIEKLMDESTAKSTRRTMAALEKHGYDTSGLSFRDQILKSTNVAKNELTNLTRTTGQLATTKMMNIYDQAYLQVTSGAYSMDQAITNAVKKLAKEGLDKVEYPTGAKRSVEAAVSVAVRTSVAQNALQCEEDMLNEMDVNLVETSSHMGARPSHAEWQGKVFWRNYPEGNYENFYQVTGYGTATGLGGYNCRHQFYAFFGEDDEETYEHIDETLNKQAYEMEQKQRSLERKLRKWDREKKILEAGGQDTTEAKKWKRYYQEQIKNLVDNSDGFLKRNYSAEKAWSSGSNQKSKKSLKQRSPQATQKTIPPGSISNPKPKLLKPPAERKDIGNLDPSIFAADNLQTREVILMKEREEHIKANHPEAYEIIMANLEKLITDPDMVIEDTKQTGTRWAILNVENSTIRLVVKLSTTKDATGYKNSIITGQLIQKTRIDRYVRKTRYEVVYKKEK